MTTQFSQDSGLNKKYTLPLPVPLTDEEVDQGNLELRQLLDEEDRVEAKKKGYMAEIKAEMAGVETRLKTVRVSLANGTRITDVEVMEVPNPATNMIEVHRLDYGVSDPGRVVDRRPMDLFEAADPDVVAARDEALALRDGESGGEDTDEDGDSAPAKLSRKKPGRKAGAGKKTKSGGKSLVSMRRG